MNGALMRLSTVASLLGLVSGCASVPTGSRVASGRPAERTQPFDDPYVRIVPVRPGRDWLPFQIINGFLSASASFDDRHAVAREYLLRDADWEPDPGPSVTVYANGSLRVMPSRTGDAQASVQVTGAQLGIIRPDGQYAAQPEAVNEVFHLARDPHGQWRIAQLPETLRRGMLLSRRDIDRAFRTMNLYFFAPDRTVLVPNAIFLPLVNRRDLPSQLTRALLSGPTAWLHNAVRNSFPAGTRLLGPGVEITDGVATVNLSREADKGDLAGMSAQLMWTLRQLVEIKFMKLEIDGNVMAPPDVGSTQSPRDWQHTNPDAVTGSGAQSAYLRGPGGRLEQLADDRTSPLHSLDDVSLEDPAMALDHRGIAGLSPARDQVLLAEPPGDGTPARTRTVLRASRRDATFTSPSFDRNGTMWTVESAGHGSSLWIKDLGRSPVRVSGAAWGLSDLRVRTLRMALDGVRVAAIVVDARRHEQIRIGRVIRDGQTVTVGDFMPISSELVDVADLAWEDANELAVLGRLQRTTAEVLPYRVPVSGGKISGIGLGAQGDMSSISAAPNSPVLVGARVPGKDSRKDQVCRLSDPQDRLSQWDCFVEGRDPFYPG